MPPTLYLDEHFSRDTAAGLTRLGASLGLQTRAFREVQPAALDPVQLQLAAVNGWTILTRDKAFLSLHDQWYVLQLWRPLQPALQHAGILLVDSRQTPDDDVARYVIGFLAHPDRPPLEDRLFVLVPGAEWWAHYPFGRRRRLFRL